MSVAMHPQAVPYPMDFRGPQSYDLAPMDYTTGYQVPQPSQQHMGPPQHGPSIFDNRYGQQPNYTLPLPKPASTFGGFNAPAPLLPAVHGNRDLSGYLPQAQKPMVKVASPKEEKIGGVSAHLDYSMDEMADFVTEMAQGMYDLFSSKICLADVDLSRSVFNTHTPVRGTALRKFVFQVLTSTRLPSSTILLAMHYMTVRLTILSGRGLVEFRPNDVYNLLTTALLLGSKFLDDNTFQNRSWSDVSNISVEKLNALEFDWLVDIDWNMHFDPADPKGFDLWLRRWQRHKADRLKLDRLAQSMKRATLETNFRGPPPSRYPVSPSSAYPSAPSSASPLYNDPSSSQWSGYQSDGWTSPSSYSPSSAPETGPATPTWVPAPSYPPGLGFGPSPMSLRNMNVPSILAMLPPKAAHNYPPGIPPPHAYRTPCTSYPSMNTYCPCQYCLPAYERYTLGSRYGQAVS